MKRFFRHPAVVRFLAALIAAYAYLVFATSRVHVVTPLPASLVSGPIVLASWHQQILMLPLMCRPNPACLRALIAASRAGTFILNVADWFGIGAVLGSSRRRGMAGARMLIRAARDGCSLFITPDGSSGPACIAKEGATEIARLTRLPLIPCAAWPARGKTFNTWDRFRFPYPFGTIHVAYGEPLEALTPEDLSNELNKLTAQVQGMSNPLAVSVA
jgi:lysophospholipid acyltransferase (LPLAT)-like uncharacterized protein